MARASSKTKTWLIVAGTSAVALLVSGAAQASHSWNDYHWLLADGELTMPVGDNVSTVWRPYLQQAITDWNKSPIIEGTHSAGQTNPKNCKPVAGRIEVCSSAYGRTGWLGIAQIWMRDGHITQAVSKMNDTYFNTATYNTPSWRSLVMCQEIGHDYGLGHQDEDFNNPDVADTSGKQTCMDYTNRPEGNEHPNQHDYDQLETHYSHRHGGVIGTTSSAAKNVASEAAGGDTPADWGRPIDYTADGRPHVYERVLAPGRRMITHVFWAMGERPRHH